MTCSKGYLLTRGDYLDYGEEFDEEGSWLKADNEYEILLEKELE
ncbi:MAG: hypothetical protein ACO2OO_02115 [Candidatus Aenigmatarchaeota archaeon]